MSTPTRYARLSDHDLYGRLTRLERGMMTGNRRSERDRLDRLAMLEEMDRREAERKTRQEA